MNKEALLHRVDSEYAYAIDENTIILVLRVSKKDHFKTLEVLYNPAMRFIKAQKKKELTLKREDDVFSYYEVRLREPFPSFSYIFHIVDSENNEYYYSDQGISEDYKYEFSQVSAFRYAFINKEDITRINAKFEGRVVYQIFVDSFASSSNDKPYVTNTWDSTDLAAFKNGKYHPVFLGGDLKGVISKIDYLKKLGVGAIYLTPIFKANSNHKYDTVDYFKIDEMFGSEEDLKALVNKCHTSDILICLDLVFNHTSFFHPFFEDVIKKGKESPYFDYYIVNGESVSVKPLNYMTFSEGFMMPKLNGNNDEVKKYCLSVAKHYLTTFNVDGFRLDVSNELPHSFWEYFSHSLRKIKPDIFLIGECWYNSSSFLNTNEWDSTMNYSFAFIVDEYFINEKEDAISLVNKLNSLLMRYKETTNYNLLNLLDSHDAPRLYEFLKPNKSRYLLAFLLLVSYIGLPMVYYGDEIFMEGGHDPFNRKGMEWDSKEFDSFEHNLFKKILALRKLDAFKKGDIEIKEINDLLLIKRTYKEDAYLVFINKGNEIKKLPINEYKEVVLANNFTHNELKEDSFVVLKV